jgi:hypothetical protein
MSITVIYHAMSLTVLLFLQLKSNYQFSFTECVPNDAYNYIIFIMDMMVKLSI